MKHLFIFTLLVVASAPSFARRCDTNSNLSTRCDAVVVSSSTSECRIIRNADRYNPNMQKPWYYVRPWERVVLTSEASTCDVDLEDCKYFAFRALEKFEYTNNCGDVSVGKRVEYRFQNLNADGSVRNEVTGRMSK